MILNCLIRSRATLTHKLLFSGTICRTSEEQQRVGVRADSDVDVAVYLGEGYGGSRKS